MLNEVGRESSFLKAVPQALLSEDHALVSVANLARENFERIADFDLSDVVARYVREHRVDIETANEHAVELKKFLAVCSAAPVGMAGPIDDVWHVFVLFTRKYAVFCRNMSGGFVHHEPDTSDEDHERSTSGYQKFIDIYEMAFQEIPPGHIWPDRTLFLDSASAGCAGCGSANSPAGCTSCSACNGQDTTVV